MQDDYVLSNLLQERSRLLTSVANVEELIKIRKAQLVKRPSASDAKHYDSKSSRDGMSTNSNEGSGNKGIMKATQDTALEMLRGGRSHVQTGEVIKATVAKGNVYTGKNPSKNASSYLKSCTELENFMLNAEKRQFAWRLRRS